MTCKLFHLTTILGKADYSIVVKKEPEATRTEVKLKEPSSCYTILFCLSIVFFVYFLLCMKYTIKKEYCKI